MAICVSSAETEARDPLPNSAVFLVSAEKEIWHFFEGTRKGRHRSSEFGVRYGAFLVKLSFLASIFLYFDEAIIKIRCLPKVLRIAAFPVYRQAVIFWSCSRRKLLYVRIKFPHKEISKIEFASLVNNAIFIMVLKKDLSNMIKCFSFFPAIWRFNFILSMNMLMDGIWDKNSLKQFQLWCIFKVRWIVSTYYCNGGPNRKTFHKKGFHNVENKRASQNHYTSTCLAINFG